MDKDKVKIKIKTRDGEVETVWAAQIGKNTFRLDSSPFFAYGLSWKDIVEAYPNKTGTLVFKKVIKKSGHKTTRVISEDKEISDSFMKQIISIGCTIEQANKNFIVIDSPETIKLEKVIHILSNSEYKWEYADPTFEEVNGLN